MFDLRKRYAFICNANGSILLSFSATGQVVIACGEVTVCVWRGKPSGEVTRMLTASAGDPSERTHEAKIGHATRECEGKMKFEFVVSLTRRASERENE